MGADQMDEAFARLDRADMEQKVLGQVEAMRATNNNPCACSWETGRLCA